MSRRQIITVRDRSERAIHTGLRLESTTTKTLLRNNLKLRTRRTERFGLVKSGVSVLFDLLRRFEINIVRERVIELTPVRRVLATNMGPRFVDSASVIVLQMFANRMNQQIPRFAFDKQRRPVVQQIPA